MTEELEEKLLASILADQAEELSMRLTESDGRIAALEAEIARLRDESRKLIAAVILAGIYIGDRTAGSAAFWHAHDEAQKVVDEHPS